VISVRLSPYRLRLGLNSGYAIDRLGAHFSSGPVTSNAFDSLPYGPQVESPPNVQLTNDTGWTQLSGSFVAPATGTYRFYPQHDDGVRLWVDGWPIVQNWIETIGTISTGTIDLVAGQRYHLRMEYFEAGLYAIARLSWQPPGGSFALMQPYELSPLYARDGDGIPDPCQVTDCNRNGIDDASL